MEIRNFILVLFLIGALGTGVELLLLGHTEDRWQLVPLVLLVLGLVAAPLVLLYPRARAVRSFRYLMLLFVAGGLAGLYLHYTGNAEFELEMYPSLAGRELVWEALTGATPALAPATMVHLGLIGLVYTFRHPSLEGDTA